MFLALSVDSVSTLFQPTNHLSHSHTLSLFPPTAPLSSQTTTTATQPPMAEGEVDISELTEYDSAEEETVAEKAEKRPDGQKKYYTPAWTHAD